MDKIRHRWEYNPGEATIPPSEPLDEGFQKNWIGKSIGEYVKTAYLANDSIRNCARIFLTVDLSKGVLIRLSYAYSKEWIHLSPGDLL